MPPGAVPTLIADDPRVLGVRDTHSVRELAEHVARARRVAVVGNGGIALELVHALTSGDAASGGGGTAASPAECVWLLKDAFIGNTFLDASASALLMPSLPVHAVDHEGQPEHHRAAEPSASGVAGPRNQRCTCCGGGESVVTPPPSLPWVQLARAEHLPCALPASPYPALP